jgi:tetratricopeptide (TPR) repeat protein
MGLLAKPGAVTIPLVICAILVAFFKPFRFSDIKGLIPWFFLSLACAVWTKLVQQAHGPGYDFSIYQRVLIASDTMLFYLYKLFYPFSPCIDYGRTPGYVLEQFWVYVSLPVSVGIVYLVSRLEKTRIWLSCFFIFIMGFFPVMGWVAFSFQKISTVADRYLYLSMIGPAMAIGHLVYRFKLRRWIYGFLVLIVSFAVTSTLYLHYWEDSETLLRYTLNKNRRSFSVHLNLGVALMRKGQLEEALTFYQKAVSIKPDSVLARYNLAIAYACKKDTPSAIKQQRIIKTSDPHTAARLEKIIPVVVQAVESGRIPKKIAQAFRMLR